MKKQWMKKMGLALGVLLMTGTVVSTPLNASLTAEAAEVVKYKAKYDLNLMSSANPTSDSLIVVKKGQEMTYLGTSGGWVKVKFGTLTGFVGATYVEKVAPPVVAPKPPVKSKSVYTTTSSLNLRSGASTKYKVLVTIPKGKAVTMISYGKSWSKVTYGNKTGYVSSSYLKKQP